MINPNNNQNKEITKERIKKLIEKYNKVIEEKRVSIYNEEMTKKDFILPLFCALGWNTEDSNEVTAEEKISRKRVDYGFRISGIPKFFLEAKSLKKDLEDPKFIKQAIDYAWNKGCTWAVLTDFESVKIFNAELKTKEISDAMFFEIKWDKYLENFEQLYLLSKEAFEQNLLDKKAEKWGKKTKKISVDKQLLADFTRFRELLSKNITKLNQSRNITEEELDESIQRILDRLIFIRNCEDRELEAKTLISSFREWESSGRGQLIKSLREVFTYFDKQYNSKIFAKHLCDSLDIDNEVLHDIIEGLYYTKDKSISYDFSAIEADVLGNIYEQYLGHILKKSEKRAKLTENHAHRKEQGIYYTPTYIVDYIVRNTLGELLKDKKVNAEKISVLDPACGSGSFLIKAFDVLNEHYAKHEKTYSQAQIDFKTGGAFTTKVKILKNNIFGVDLDKQAVEIAQLNLLLKIAEKGQSLPVLQENIKCGNSLIDDPAIAGDKAFKWEEEFKEVIAEGGFDVVVGNPPYVRNRELKKHEKKFMNTYFETAEGQYDIYQLFFEKSIKLLKEGGLLGFITSNKYATAEYGKKLRKFILDNCRILFIVDVSNIDVFKDASTYPYILILQKTSKKDKIKNNKINVIRISHENELYQIKPISTAQSNFNTDKNFTFNLSIMDSRLIEKIKSDSISLGDICEIREAIHTGNIREKVLFNQKKNEACKKVIGGRDISRYNSHWNGKWILYDPKIINRQKGEYGNFPDKKYFDNPKLLIRDISLRMTATYDDSKLYCLNTLYSTILKESVNDFDLKYILAIINSNLVHYFFKSQFSGAHVRGGYLRFKPMFSKQVPIKQIPESQQQSIIKLVDKMLSLNKRLNEIGDKKTDERAKIEEEIKKTDTEIDRLVYNLYGLTEDEIKIVEEK